MKLKDLLTGFIEIGEYGVDAASVQICSQSNFEKKFTRDLPGTKMFSSRTTHGDGTFKVLRKNDNFFVATGDIEWDEEVKIRKIREMKLTDPVIGELSPDVVITDLNETFNIQSVISNDLIGYLFTKM